MDTKKIIEILKKENLLKVIDKELDIYLEIPHIAYFEVKKNNSKALLFTNPVDKRNGKKYSIPVLMNIFGSFKAVEIFIGNVNNIAKRIDNILHITPPHSFKDKITLINTLFSLKSVFPKRKLKKGICQEIVKIGKEAKLSDIPILTTWPKDASPFITMGQVYTKNLNGSINNLGMYRLQVFDDYTLGMHWQIHKDGNNIFSEYKKAKKKMPVSIAIGGDPLYIWCGQAPLPHGIFELLLYGFIKGKNVKMVKSITNDIFIPEDVDFVIEGMVDTEKLKIEGPFGDHTGYYTLEEKYPFMEIKAITHRKNPVYHATVVGKPPLEDKYMGYATERIFLPLFKTTVPDLIDYHMPENGVFHNLILAKIRTRYPGHATQIMHAFWGVGQMSFVKHAIFVSENAPELTDYFAISKYILNRIDIKNILITNGILDALDHSSDNFAYGSKLGIDCTGEEIGQKPDIINDENLLKIFKDICNNITSLKQYFLDTNSPITIIKINKKEPIKLLFKKIYDILKFIKILIVLDDKYNNIDNLYMILWRVVNNIDAKRDIVFYKEKILIDATNKSKIDGFYRKWPEDVLCDRNVIQKLIKNNILEIDENFIDYNFY